MRYGFIIDNRKCIGCHACSVVCKAEHRVPLGVHRTWVKYVEKGEFPQTRRFFQVTRCNHCTHPPCVTICPTGAMYQRKDGIVDFDPVRCVGCKACQQACPYDAIYIDPDLHTAAKCNFCAHRTERGMEPACVAICPERAIIAGDMDRPGSEIAHILAREQLRVRKPEQGTQPNVYYVQAEDGAIVPTVAQYESGYLWAEQNKTVRGGGAIRGGVGSPSQPAVRAVYDVEHARPWGWQVPAVFWTKSIGAGLLALPALAMALHRLTPNRTLSLLLTSIALFFTALSAGLLVWELDRRGRFLRVVLRPQLGSWLARGAYCLVAYSVLATLYWVAAFRGSASAPLLLWLAVLGGGMATVYTAFLFGQCEGRDLWQNPLLPTHVLLQAVLASATALALVPASLGGSQRSLAVAATTLALGLGLHVVMLLGQFGMRHATDNAHYAASLITQGPFRRLFWRGAVLLGGVLPALLLLIGWSHAGLVGLAGVLALTGMLACEWCFVMAGQGVPNS